MNNLRKYWLNMHRYLGLSAGSMFVLLGLTGTINAFWVELDSWLNPQLVISQTQGDCRSLDEILKAVQAVHPNRNGSWELVMPPQGNGMLTAIYSKPEEKMDEFYAGLWVDVNPYTAEVVRSYFWGDTAMTWIFDLHSTLLLGQTGQNIVGIFGLVFMFSLGTGLYLWWPSSGRVSQAFIIKRGASNPRLVFDIHRVTGVYGILILLMVAFSGIYMIYPEYIDPIVANSPDQKNPKDWTSTTDPGTKPISIAQAILIAKRVFPDAEVKRISTPNGKLGVYKVALRQPSEIFKTSYPETQVWIDQYSGTVLGSNDPKEYTNLKTFLSIQWELHSGQAFGLAGRILDCLVGLVPSILYITGFVRWLQKRRAGQKNRHKSGIAIKTGEIERETWARAVEKFDSRRNFGLSDRRR
ncbi:MAG: PepSY-associated TM helix domain-containing protein [Methylococcales bacterium]